MMNAKMKKAKKTEPTPELRESRWAVISFDRCAAHDLTYEEAEEKMAELMAANVSGLCIVTNDTAERFKSA